MGGVRVRHHTRRGQMLPVPLLFEPWPENRTVCAVCRTVHPCKVLHLDLDDTGAVVVSPEIWGKIRQVATAGGFRAVNPVLHPPAQGIAPETVKANIQGISVGGGLQVAEKKKYATSRLTPTIRTVSLDEYVDIANRHGIGTAVALNVLMRNYLGLGEKR